jgi:hypothetical protein
MLPSVFISGSEESANDEAGSSVLRLEETTDDEPTVALYVE